VSVLVKRRGRTPRANTKAWRELPDGSRARPYGSYAEYAKHQASKLATMEPERLEAHGRKFSAALVERLGAIADIQGAWVVLCLGARDGSEVWAFQQLGCFAVGIDLNPGKANPYVLHGDFHATRFPPASVDVIYTNALDHVYDLGQVLKEAKRLLRPQGVLIVEATTKRPGEWESFVWASQDALLAAIEAEGFNLLHRAPIEVPWPGETFVLGVSE
jgi:SAM-dependent methyltransferase